MLEKRRQGYSLIIYLLFGLLVVIFVLGINPGSKGNESGCAPTGSSVLEVDGWKVTTTGYHVAFSNRFNQGPTKQREYAAIEMLIRRELLAQAASERGIRVTSEMVDEEIKRGFFFLGGHRVPLGEAIFDQHDDGTKTWNFGKFKQWVGGLNVTVASYKDDQARGLQAALMQELLINEVRVSREEAKTEYLFKNTTITYDTVEFSPGAYRQAMRLTDADIQRYLAAHEDEVRARFKSDERTYKDVKPQLRLREIFIAKAEPAATPPADEKKPDEKKPDEKKPPDDNKKAEADKKPNDNKTAEADKKAAADKAADDKKAADKKVTDKKVADKKAAGATKPVGLPIEEAKTKLEAARAAIAAGKRKFVDAAKELSTDEALKASGGDMGWRTAADAALGDKALSDAVKELEPGEMTPVIVADNGVYLIQAEAKRPVGDAKDLTYEQVKNEIAAELAKDAWSKEAAKRAALTAFAEATKDKGKPKSLDVMFEREVKPFNFDPNMNPSDQQRMIEEQLRQQLEQQGDQGSITYESPDVAAAWKTEGDGGGGSAAGSGSATGSATGSAAGSGAGSGAGTPAKPPIPPPLPAIEPTKDALPSFADMPKPKVKSQGPFPRGATLPGLPKEATVVLWDELSQGMFVNRVYESNGNYVVVQLTHKRDGANGPSTEDFDKEAPKLISQLRSLRAAYSVEDWLKHRCEALAKEGKIIPAGNLFRDETDAKGNKIASTYRPCMAFH